MKVRKPTARFLPIEGLRKSPPKDNAHVGADGKTRLRVKIYRDSGIVMKCNIANWTPEANAKFAEMYCKGVEGKDEGEEFGKSTKRKKKDAAQDQLAEMQKMLEKMAAENAALKAAQSAPIPVAECKTVDVEDEKKVKAEKKAKMEALKKAKAEKKAKADAEKKAKAEALKAQLALLQQQEEELEEFDDSDDDGQEFNPYEHNGVEYHLDDENQLYTQEGEHYGYIDEDGNVVEAEDE